MFNINKIIKLILIAAFVCVISAGEGLAITQKVTFQDGSSTYINNCNGSCPAGSYCDTSVGLCKTYDGKFVNNALSGSSFSNSSLKIDTTPRIGEMGSRQDRLAATMREATTGSKCDSGQIWNDHLGKCCPAMQKCPSGQMYSTLTCKCLTPSSAGSNTQASKVIITGCSGNFGLFSGLITAGQDIFKGLRDLIYVVAGFGIIGVAVGGFFGNLNWKWLGAIVIALIVIATTGELLAAITNCQSFTSTYIQDTLK